jgi:hypothetical protein
MKRAFICVFPAFVTFVTFVDSAQHAWVGDARGMTKPAVSKQAQEASDTV